MTTTTDHERLEMLARLAEAGKELHESAENEQGALRQTEEAAERLAQAVRRREKAEAHLYRLGLTKAWGPDDVVELAGGDTRKAAPGAKVELTEERFDPPPVPAKKPRKRKDAATAEPAPVKPAPLVLGVDVQCCTPSALDESYVLTSLYGRRQDAAEPCPVLPVTVAGQPHCCTGIITTAQDRTWQLRRLLPPLEFAAMFPGAPTSSDPADLVRTPADADARAGEHHTGVIVRDDNLQDWVIGPRSTAVEVVLPAAEEPTSESPVGSLFRDEPAEGGAG